MPFYHSRDLRLHYVCREPEPAASAPALIFEHGIGGDVRQPGRFLAPERTGISPKALRIVHADLRGHGASDIGPTEDLSIAALGRDLAALLDHLELQHVIAGGISMGAAAVLRFAVDYPERCRALILCRPAWTDGPMSAEARQVFARIADLLAAEDWQSSAFPALVRSEILQSIEAACPDAAKSVRGQLQSVLDHPEDRPRAMARLRHLPFSKGLDTQGSLAAVRCPTIILAPEGDPIHPFEYASRLAESIADCRLVRIAAKSAADDQPHLWEVDRIVGAFLSLAIFGRDEQYETT